MGVGERNGAIGFLPWVITLQQPESVGRHVGPRCGFGGRSEQTGFRETFERVRCGCQVAQQMGAARLTCPQLSDPIGHFLFDERLVENAHGVVHAFERGQHAGPTQRHFGRQLAARAAQLRRVFEVRERQLGVVAGYLRRGRAQRPDRDEIARREHQRRMMGNRRRTKIEPRRVMHDRPVDRGPQRVGQVGNQLFGDQRVVERERLASGHEQSDPGRVVQHVGDFGSAALAEHRKGLRREVDTEDGGDREKTLSVGAQLVHSGEHRCADTVEWRVTLLRESASEGDDAERLPPARSSSSSSVGGGSCPSTSPAIWPVTNGSKGDNRTISRSSCQS